MSLKKINKKIISFYNKKISNNLKKYEYKLDENI